MTILTKKIEVFYNNLAPKFDSLKKKNFYYHQQLTKLYKFLIPPKKRVLEIGCATGNLLASLKPVYGVGIDISEQMILLAKKKHPQLLFKKQSAEYLKFKEKFDYIILSDLVGILEDIQLVLSTIYFHANDDTRIIFNYTNYFWEPFLLIATHFGYKTPQPIQSWLSQKDLQNLLYLTGFDIVKQGGYMLIPVNIPYLSSFVNKYIARLPLIKNFCFVQYIVARKTLSLNQKKEYSVSVILPARNEAGNIETAVRTIPKMGSKTEIIFVEDHSKDNTREEIKRVIKKYSDKKNIRLFVQSNEFGKAAAVRKGFEKATGDILMICDSDLTTDPKDLPKFYAALHDRKGEFIQGSRLIYSMEKQAMRFLNVLGNKFFSMAFTFLLDQPIKDTLCGTKVLFKKDYEKIVANRDYFGDFDPFGDFDLIFGATKLNLKIIEIPVRYKARVYGKSNISRFRHGWLLLKMTIFAAKKIKFF